MKIAIHAKPQSFFVAMLAMALGRLGHEVVLQSRDDWSGPLAGADLVFVHGLRPAILEAYAGTPVVVLESGYLKRVNTRAEAQSGHWQLSLGGLNRIPDFECSGDRFASLDLKIERPVKRKDGYVLVLGQTPTDSALGGQDHQAWLLDQIASYSSEGHEVRYRPHPRGGIDLPGVESMTGTLEDALAGASLVVTYNSTAGFRALLTGVPVICDPCAPYHEISGKTCPNIRARWAFFKRVAYGQWRIDEIPQALNFLFSEWLPRWQS